MDKSSVRSDQQSYASSKVTSDQDSEVDSIYSYEKPLNDTIQASQDPANGSSSTEEQYTPDPERVWNKGTPYTTVHQDSQVDDVGEKDTQNHSATALAKGKETTHATQTQRVFSERWPYQVRYRRCLTHKSKNFDLPGLKRWNVVKGDTTYHELAPSVESVEIEDHLSYIQDHITPIIDAFVHKNNRAGVKQRNTAWRELVETLDKETARNPIPEGLLITLSRDDYSKRSKLPWHKHRYPIVPENLTGTNSPWSVYP